MSQWKDDDALLASARQQTLFASRASQPSPPDVDKDVCTATSQREELLCLEAVLWQRFDEKGEVPHDLCEKRDKIKAELSETVAKLRSWIAGCDGLRNMYTDLSASLRRFQHDHGQASSSIHQGDMS